MHKLMLGALALATLAVAQPAPADAQVSVYGGESGVAVRVGRDHDDGYRHHRGYRAYAHERCRDVTVRTVRPNGTVVVRKTQRCR